MPSPWSQEKYIEAYFYAAEALKTKLFKGTDLPYMVHVSLVSMEVMATLQAESDLDGNLALQSALLHDVIEDGGKTFDNLLEAFDAQVAQGVLALSRNRQLPESQQIADSLDRIKEQPREIWIVKMADRITNLLPPPRDWTSKKIETYRKEALLIYKTLEPASRYLADRLSAKITAYEKYNKQKYK